MALPILAKPVTRPHFVEPSTSVDIEHEPGPDGIYIKRMWLTLIFGANYNDPARFQYAGYRQIMSSAITRWGS
jgi:cyanobactin biosynthesis protein (PatB/AcyB/McaB family)